MVAMTTENKTKHPLYRRSPLSVFADVFSSQGCFYARGAS